VNGDEIRRVRAQRIQRGVANAVAAMDWTYRWRPTPRGIGESLEILGPETDLTQEVDRYISFSVSTTFGYAVLNMMWAGKMGWAVRVTPEGCFTGDSLPAMPHSYSFVGDIQQIIQQIVTPILRCGTIWFDGGMPGHHPLCHQCPYQLYCTSKTEAPP